MFKSILHIIALGNDMPLIFFISRVLYFVLYLSFFTLLVLHSLSPTLLAEIRNPQIVNKKILKLFLYIK